MTKRQAPKRRPHQEENQLPVPDRAAYLKRTSLLSESVLWGRLLAFYLERKTKPRRANDAARPTLALLSKVPGRREMSYAEEDWIDDEATSHRGLDK
jgi:hypothetical protein